MKRKEILNSLANEIKDRRINYPIFEMFLTEENTHKRISINRSLFLTECNNIQKDEIVRLFSEHEVDIEDKDIRQYLKEEDLLKSDLLPQEKVDIFYNWRGRILEWEKISLKKMDEIEFEESILSSHWLLVVSKRDNNYFVNYYITPYYYYTGRSIVGVSKKEYEDKVEKIVNYFYDKNNEDVIDMMSDRLSIFTRILPNEKEFVKQKIPLFGEKDYLPIKELLKIDKEKILEEICAKLQEVFQNDPS